MTPEDPDGRPAGTLPPLDTSAASAPAPPAAPAPAEVAEAASDPAPVPAATVPAADVPAVAPAAAPIETAALDPALVGQGEAAFKKCSACHKVGEGAKNGTGPVLNGIFGAAAGHADEFKYSKALTDKAAEGLVWNEAELDAFLENPKGFMKGTKMAFAGLKKPDERAAIIAYLRSLGN
nr:cytochrome c family protein [Agrobacterium sp. MA01]